MDASRLRFASPLELVAIGALSHSAAASGGKVILVVPELVDVASYLQRMDVFTALPSNAEVVGDLPDEERRDMAKVLVELTQLFTSAEAEEIAQRVVPVARHHSDANVTNAVFYGLGELLDNACTHADSEPGVFVAAQSYSGRTSGRRGLELAVADAGVGILGHLSGNPKYARFRRETTAIEWAMRPGVTGTMDQRGYGFSDVLREAGEAGVGRMVIRSGHGIGRVSVKGGRLRREFYEADFDVPGTWVWLRVRVP